jgi:hypothetical protein
MTRRTMPSRFLTPHLSVIRQPVLSPGERVKTRGEFVRRSSGKNIISQIAQLNQPMLFVLLVLALFSASFDIFLSVKIYDSQVRLSQLIELGFIFFALVLNSYGRHLSWPLGFGYALCWASFVILWTPNTYDIGFSILYSIWLIVSLVKIYAMCQFLREKNDIITLYRAYIMTFVVVSTFGLIQFVAGRFGVSLLVKQWWFAGFPRVNGFSYEPSYFATYLISGWGICVYLIERQNDIFSKSRNTVNFLIVTAALLLSTSRMGVIVVGTYIGFYILRLLCRLIFWKKISSFDTKLLVALVFVGVPLCAYIFNRVNFAAYRFLLSGTGLAGTASHSSTVRLGQFGETIDLFLKSPVIGYGMGGIGSYLGRVHGLAPNVATGMNVTAEVLASSGLLGFPFFVLFVGTVLFKPLTKRFAPGELRDALQSAAVGTILLLVILQFNQSILRLYVWNHIAIVCVLFAGCSRFSRLTPRTDRMARAARLHEIGPRSSYGVRPKLKVQFNRGSSI